MTRLPVLNSNEEFFVFLLHLMAEEFGGEAVLKGGMVLKLLGSNRETLDLDYTFVPFKSKKHVLERIEKLFTDIKGIQFEIKLNSKAIRVNLSAQKLRAQIEINVAMQLKSELISTANLAPAAARVIRIMSLDVALANKLAAWNERRLLRDLYDIYYFLSRQGIEPDWNVLDTRLGKIESRIPKLKKIQSMTRLEFADSLEEELKKIDQNRIEDELSELLDPVEVPGLSHKFKDIIGRLLILLRSNEVL